jgi:hypothetical protein
LRTGRINIATKAASHVLNASVPSLWFIEVGEVDEVNVNDARESLDRLRLASS